MTETKPKSETQRIRRNILKMAIPAILSNITVPLMGLSDTAISGHLGSELFLAAIAAGTMMGNVIFWLFGFLRMGTTGLTAEAFGSGDKSYCRVVFSRAFYLGIGAGLIILLLSPLLSKLLLIIISPSEEVKNLANQYFMVIILGAPAQLATMAVTGWFIGMQTTTRPMIVAISSNIINIVCSMLAVFIFNLGFIGIALGTLIANWVGLVIAIILAISKSGKYLFISPLKVWKVGGCGSFFKISSDLFFRSACIMSVTMMVTSIGARLGADILASNTVIMQFFIFFSYFMDGFAFSAEALCGKAVGLRDYFLFRKILHGISFWGLVMTATACIIYVIFWLDIIKLITDVDNIRANVASLRGVMWILPIVSVAGFLLDGIYIGLTATRQMLIATFSSLIIFLIIVLGFPEINRLSLWLPFAEESLNSDILLWVAFMGYLATRGVVLCILLPRTAGKRFEL